MSRRIQWFVSLSAFLTALAACIILSSGVHAASPLDIKLKYDLNKHLLLVTVANDAIQEGSNYVKFVEIKKNGSVVSIHTYSSQTEGKALTYQYRVNAIEEDTLQVVVTFNKSGSRTSPLLVVAP